MGCDHITLNRQPTTQPKQSKPNNKPGQPTVPKRNTPLPAFPTRSFNRQRTAPSRKIPSRSLALRQHSLPTHKFGISGRDATQEAEEPPNLRTNENIPQKPEATAMLRNKKQDPASQQMKGLREKLQARGVLPIVHENKKSKNNPGPSTEQPEQQRNPELRRSERSTN